MDWGRARNLQSNLDQSLSKSFWPHPDSCLGESPRRWGGSGVTAGSRVARWQPHKHWPVGAGVRAVPLGGGLPNAGERGCSLEEAPSPHHAPSNPSKRGMRCRHGNGHHHPSSCHPVTPHWLLSLKARRVEKNPHFDDQTHTSFSCPSIIGAVDGKLGFYPFMPTEALGIFTIRVPIIPEASARIKSREDQLVCCC